MLFISPTHTDYPPETRESDPNCYKEKQNPYAECLVPVHLESRGSGDRSNEDQPNLFLGCRLFVASVTFLHNVSASVFCSRVLKYVIENRFMLALLNDVIKQVSVDGFNTSAEHQCSLLSGAEDEGVFVFVKKDTRYPSRLTLKSRNFRHILVFSSLIDIVANHPV